MTRTAQTSRTGADSQQRMRHCFMTGKQCIFRTRASGPVAPESPAGVFVVMPFQPNLDTFFDWSLRPFLENRVKDITGGVTRADRNTPIGYIMCEGICRHIQDAELVVVDLSVRNPNVFYELGLSVGLSKRLLITCDQQCFNHYGPDHWASIGIDEKQIIQYPNVGALDIAPGRNLSDYEIRFKLAPRRAAMRVHALLIPDRAQDVHESRDIQATFESVVRAAVGVAMAEIDQARKNASTADPELAAAATSLGEESIGALCKCSTRYLVSASARGEATSAPYSQVEEEVVSSFVNVIDLYQEHPLAYFWLGYCHARGINVIPVIRHEESPASGGDDPSILAFDIRSLWCARYDRRQPDRLAGTFRSFLTELIMKDVPTQQRRIFWERLTHRNVAHIYTGAISHDGLAREMVGDWDLRTVSELVRYLSSSQESVLPRFMSPVYSPESIEEKLRKDTKGEEGQSGRSEAAADVCGTTRLSGSLGESSQTEGLPKLGADTGGGDHDVVRDRYLDLAIRELREHPCSLIVASADVNPFTETVLARCYQPRFGRPWRRLCFPGNAEGQVSDVQVQKVVAIKGTQNLDEKWTRQFSVQKCPGLRESHRGFLVDGRLIQEKYSPQGDVGDEFDVLGHLVVVRNPFSANRDDLIVILDGVSGPGTFGLAEVLTGGDTDKKAAESERILRRINEFWDRHSHEEYFGGIEAFIAVHVDPRGRMAAAGQYQDPSVPLESKEASTGGLSNGFGEEVARKFYDNRVVVHWKMYNEDPKLEENLRVIRVYPEVFS